MPSAVSLLLVVLAVVGIGFVLFWWRRLALVPGIRPTPYDLLVGAITDFFDTWGIGSFATTTSLWRARRTVPDEQIPGTLNVGHTLPTIAQAFIFTNSVEVEPWTLISMIVAAVAGALLGAPVVCRLPRRQVQIGLGIALLVLCSVLVFRQFHDIDKVPGSRGVAGATLVVALVANFVLGALMTIGVGLYAPCLVLVFMLGMDTDAGFPIMMSSCAFLMPIASVPFVRNSSYSPRAALGLTLAGVPAVLLAAYAIKKLPLYWVNWAVAVVVIYTAVTLLRASRKPAAGAAD
jgi:uncharacterized membrane protein YfcA